MSAKVVAEAVRLKSYPRVLLRLVQVFGQMAVLVEPDGMKHVEVVDPVLEERFI